MNLEPYYEGDDVTLEFSVKEGLYPVTPYSASVSIYRGKEEIIFNQQAEILGDKVRFDVDNDYTKQRGDYKAVFTVYITPTISRTHVRWFRVLPKGAVISKGKDAELSKSIGKDSDDHAVDQALGMALRSLRKVGESLVKVSKQASDILSKKTGRRMPIDHYNDEDY